MADAAGLAAGSLSEHTLRGYGSAWSRWTAWCRAHGAMPLPASPGHVAVYAASLYAGPRPLRPVSVDLALSAINTAHRLAGHPQPARSGPAATVQKGARRRHGTRPLAAKDPLLLDGLRQVAATALHPPDRRRDAALCALAAAGLTPARLAALDWTGVTADPDGTWTATDHLGTAAVARNKNGPCPAAAIAAARPPDRAGPVSATGARGPMTRQGITALLRRTADRAGIPLPDRGPPDLAPPGALPAVLARLAQPGPRERRDHLLLLLGWIGAQRRSGLAGLDWADITPEPDGDLRVLVRASKNDPDRIGHTFWAAPGQHPLTCPVRALHAWHTELTALLGHPPAPNSPLLVRLDPAGTPAPGPDGQPRRMSPAAVSDTVARHSQAAGNPRGTHTAHSLRTGLITQSAGTEGVSPLDIQAVSGHKQLESVLRYVRPVHARQRHPARRMDL